MGASKENKGQMPRASYPQFLAHLLPELLVSLHGSPASVSRAGRLKPAVRQRLVSADSGLRHLLVRNEGPSGLQMLMLGSSSTSESKEGGRNQRVGLRVVLGPLRLGDRINFSSGQTLKPQLCN